MVNGTLLNFGKRYGDNLRVIFDQCSKMHLGLDALTNQKILNSMYLTILSMHLLVDLIMSFLQEWQNFCPTIHYT